MVILHVYNAYVLIRLRMPQYYLSSWNLYNHFAVVAGFCNNLLESIHALSAKLYHL